MSKRKKTSSPAPAAIDATHATVEAHAEPLAPDPIEPNESVTTRATVPPELMKRAMGELGELDDDEAPPTGKGDTLEIIEEPIAESVDVPMSEDFDSEMTVNLVGDLPLPGRDDLDEPTVAASGEALEEVDRLLVQRKHLRGLVEALVFASDSPIKPNELAKLAHAPVKLIKELLPELQTDYATRGIHLDEVAGGWVFRTSPQYAPFVRDLTKQKPVRLTRAQVETLAIIAYRQPITRPEVDDVRGVDSGPVVKLLLERDLIRILGKRDEPGRPLIYGTTNNFLEFFGLKSLKDLPTLREFTELSDESREAFEEELGETPEDAARHPEHSEGHAVEHAQQLAEQELSGDPPKHDDTDEHIGDHLAAEDAGTHVDKGEGALEAEHQGRAVRESMRVPIGEQPLEDLGDDDLEPMISSSEDSEAAPHASDEDGPTLTSEAPANNDNDNDD